MSVRANNPSSRIYPRASFAPLSTALQLGGGTRSSSDPVPGTTATTPPHPALLTPTRRRTVPETHHTTLLLLIKALRSSHCILHSQDSPDDSSLCGHQGQLTYGRGGAPTACVAARQCARPRRRSRGAW
jgi:hypothetical protein